MANIEDTGQKERHNVFCTLYKSLASIASVLVQTMNFLGFLSLGTVKQYKTKRL